MEKYTVKNGKKLKYGFTTGSCAAAAASASAAMLLSGEKQAAAEIMLPSGEKVWLSVENQHMEPCSAVCSVTKDGGDDPDATHGAKIFARVSFSTGEPQAGQIPVKKGALTLLGGAGVGRVTSSGLQCAPGEPAINPVPRNMIFANVEKIRRIWGDSRPLTIEISVPDGAEIAKKTFNPRLGIKGGISILGTTGIVDPMSEKALIDTIKAMIDRQYAENSERILIAPGNYGRAFCKEYLGFEIERAVPVSNYIGEALDYICYKGFHEILLVGHTGKLIKIAAGIMNTHSSYADGRMEIIGVHSAALGADAQTVRQILECITTDDAFELIFEEPYYEEVKRRILDRVLYHLNFRLKGTASIETIMFTTDRRHIIKSAGAELLAEKIRKDQQQ